MIGNDQEIAAIAAAIADEARFYVTGPEINRLMITLGEGARFSQFNQHSWPKATASAPGCDLRRTVKDACRRQPQRAPDRSV